MKKKILSLALAMIMLLGLIPASVFTASAYSAGPFNLLSEETLTSSDYSWKDNVLTILSDKAITIQNANQSKATNAGIYIESGVNANITLAGVNIDRSNVNGGAALKIADNSAGNVTITLEAGMTNYLLSGSGAAGLQKAGDFSGDLTKGKLTIQGRGTLKAVGKGIAAGIGGGTDQSASNITINDAAVTAVGSGIYVAGTGVDELFERNWKGGAGIGGAGRQAVGAYITINNATVTATGGVQAAGIGGGGEQWYYIRGHESHIGGSGHHITINNSAVTAVGADYSAGIGGSYYSSGEYITISGENSMVYATGGRSGAGIGGGMSAPGSNITIDDGIIIEATGGQQAAGIGGGMYGEGKFITINGGTIKATAGTYNDESQVVGGAAGIGGGYCAAGTDITINGGDVTASGLGEWQGGAGIGGGFDGAATNIIINGGTVRAYGGDRAAGIGSTTNYDATDIKIYGGRILAVGGYQGYDIGSTTYHERFTVYIYGGQFAVGNLEYQTVYGFSVIRASVYKVASDPEFPYLVTSKGYNISFDANGGKATMDPMFLPGDVYGNLPECTLVAPEGKGFAGWSLTPDGDIITKIIVYSDTTVYAIWADIYTVSFDGNGGSGSMNTVNILTTDDYTLPHATFEAPQGKYFKGWATSPTGEVITSSTISISADTKLYAIWADVEADGIKTVLDVSKGGVSIGDGRLSAYAPDGTHLKTPDPDGYIIIGTSNEDGKQVNITDGIHSIIIRDLSIDVSRVYYATAFNIDGDAKVYITLEGKNTLKSGFGCAGICVPSEVSSVIITAESTGSLTAIGGGGATGIGGRYRAGGGSVTIEGGKIYAKAGDEWLNGLGAGNLGTCGYVTITGGSFNVGDVDAKTVCGILVAGGYIVKQGEDADYPYEVVVNPCEHKNTVLHSGSSPDCGTQTNGRLDYYLCECGDKFYDAESTRTVTRDDDLVIKWAHDIDNEWIDDELDHWHVCLDCGFVQDKAHHSSAAPSPTGTWICDICNRAYGTSDGIKTVLDISKGRIVIDHGILDAYSPDGAHLTTPDWDGYIIIGSTTQNDIDIDGGDHTIILRDLTMDTSAIFAMCPLSISGGANVTLILEGTNSISSSYTYAALNLSQNSGSVIITGDGKLYTNTTGGYTISVGSKSKLTIEGGYISTNDLVNKGVLVITGGYFAVGDEDRETVYGFSVAEGYDVVKLGDGGDFPYAVVPAHIHGNSTFQSGSLADCKTETDGLKDHYVCECGSKFYDAACTEPVRNDSDLVISWKSAHKLTHHDAVSNCCYSGNIEYWSCSVCAKNFSDEGKTVADDISTAPTGAHTGTAIGADDDQHWYICQVGGTPYAHKPHSGGTANCEVGKICSDCSREYGATDPDNHTSPEFTYKDNEDGATHTVFNKCCGAVASPADGHIYGDDFYCDLCNYCSHTHGQGKLVGGYPSDCISGTYGRRSYYICSCGDKFYDYSCTEPLLDESDLDFDYLHSIINIPRKRPDCCNDGNIEYWECVVCGKKFTDDSATDEITDVTIPATGDHTSTEPESDATGHWYICTEDGNKINFSEHTPNIPAATEESAKYCTGCNYIIEEQLAHTHKGGSATCTKKAVCVGCGLEYGELAAHSFKVAVNDEDQHWNKCENCDAIDAKTDHAYGNDNACDVCGYEKPEDTTTPPEETTTPPEETTTVPEETTAPPEETTAPTVETTVPTVETTEPAPGTTEPGQSGPTGDSAVFIVLMTLVSVISLAFIATKKREKTE